MRQMYVFAGIDLQKTKEDASKKSHGETVIVHYHAKSRRCQGFLHEHYYHGAVIDHWGTEDGSGLAPSPDGDEAGDGSALGGSVQRVEPS
jgi:hypothetical protein